MLHEIYLIYRKLHRAILQTFWLGERLDGEFVIFYIFALHNINNSCWVPIHIREPITLQERHSDIATLSTRGIFVVHKTKRPFSAIAIDHVHEQNNKVMKGDGAAVGLLQKPAELDCGGI